MGDAVGVDRRTRRLEAKITRSDCALPEIDGWRLSCHAAARMVARRIEIDWVREALTRPGRPNHPSGTRKHVGDMAMCVVSEKAKVIVTVGFGSRNGDPRQ
ncbi:DUF4258 domain-containing protein [Mycobacterium sp. SMC-4]|uniref:DUF4258 domain-containing protein n=1 Tax=Mycobacterium sp. SMC-4 TaxID=2857059 RepID=UPI0021B3C4BA|nr:DUF4258 domain-containing protein [Mycobacterium sp. SMC-4]UXA19494.1 DUF4258 domain-containing protein [Mycobacterium sp. SMC-4]